MMWEYFNGSGYGWENPVIWMTFQAFLIVAGIALIIFLVRKGTHGKNVMQQRSPTARQILDERYTKGEIDKETYEQMKKDIQ
jgi:putative membrane protein